MATKITSPISCSVAPALAARPTWASMHHGHCVMCAMPSATSSFVFCGSAPAANALLSKSRKLRYAYGTSSRIRLNCFLVSTP